MSRAFVREKDVDYLEDMPGTTDLRTSKRRHRDRPDANRTCSRCSQRSLHRCARSADRAALAAAGRDLRYWTSRRAAARVVSESTDWSEVRFGTAVTIMLDDGREQTFRIVGEDEADPSQGSISHVSPLAKAMFGKRVGGVVRVEIVQIQ